MSQINEKILQDILTAAEYRKLSLDEITPAPYNPRVDLTPEDPEYQKIRQSILDHGLLQPIVYNKNTGYAVGGNQRLKILREMGVREATCAIINVPLVREMEISVALNKLDNLWDREKLREIMIQLKDQKYDANQTAFDPYEVEQLTKEMDLSVSGFFQDQEDEESKEKTQHTYKCPYCDTIFVK